MPEYDQQLKTTKW